MSDFNLQYLTRPVQKNIPPSPQERRRLLLEARSYVSQLKVVPPITLDQLNAHAERLQATLGCNPIYRDYISLLVNNELWRGQLAGIPFERRLLLLPKCLRVESKCPASFDQLGLLCENCGLCPIQDLAQEAEALGYSVLVAEGSAVVMNLIKSGKIEAVIGVSCLNVLRKAFPHMEAGAVPGIAIPLLQDDCADTSVDLDWVWEYLQLTADKQARRLNLGQLRQEASALFAASTLDAILGPAQGKTEQIAREWLGRAGKRWRPFLTLATYQALTPMGTSDLPATSPDQTLDEASSGGSAKQAPRQPVPSPGGEGQGEGELSRKSVDPRPFLKLDGGTSVPANWPPALGLQKIAVAVECFHKASLIHDDIEDNDATRYGEKTLHEEHGVPVALNVGDLLIGEGYRLLAESGASPEACVEMLRVASQGQHQLCRGQGAELLWSRSPVALSSDEVLDIFRKKTAPAFEVALRLGAIFAGAHDQCKKVLGNFSDALGIAYQIRDDLEDFGSNQASNDLIGRRPGLVLSIAREHAQGPDRDFLDQVWHAQIRPDPGQLEALCRRLEADKKAEQLLAQYKEAAINSIAPLEQMNLKALLRRVVGRIFNEVEFSGWCGELEKQQGASK